MRDLALKKFNLKNFKINSKIVIFGKSGTGKSSMLRWILYAMHKKFRIGMLISETADMNHEYDGIFPDALIFQSFVSEKMNQFLKHQIELRLQKEANNPKYVNKILEALIVMDDCFGRSVKWAKDPFIRTMMYQARHYFITLILSAQQPLSIPSEFRNAIDYVIIKRTNLEKERKKLFENYWNTTLGDYDDFNEILNKCTENWGAMVIDNKAMDAGDSIEKSIFYLRTPDPKYLPKFRIGNPEIWQICKRRFNREWIRHLFENALKSKKKGPSVSVKLK